MRAIAQQCSYVVGGTEVHNRHADTWQPPKSVAKVEAAVILWRQWDAVYSLSVYSGDRWPRRWCGHRVCVCNMLRVHAVRLVSHTRYVSHVVSHVVSHTFPAVASVPRTSLRGCRAVAGRRLAATRDDPDSESFPVRYARTVPNIYRTRVKARRLRHAATRDFLAELAASRGAGRSCLDSGTSRPSTLPRR